MSKANHDKAKVGTQFVGALARRLLNLKKSTGMPARRINELIVEHYLPDLESGKLKIELTQDGPILVEVAKAA